MMKSLHSRLATTALLCTATCFAHAGWPTVFHSATGDTSLTTAMETDSKGNVYIAGGTFGNGTGRDVLLVKYNQYGVYQWSQTYGGTSNDEYAMGLAIDETDSPYLLASEVAAGQTDFLTLKYDKIGALKWLKHLGGAGGSNDNPIAIKPFPTGGVVVTGYTNGGASAGRDVIPIDMKIDPFDSIFIAGDSLLNLGANGSNFYVTQLDSAGTKQWAKTYAGDDSGSSDNEVSGLEVDLVGNVNVGGVYQDSVSGGYYYVMVRYSSKGQRNWVRIDSLGPNGQSFTAATAMDQQTGRVYLTGRSYNPSTSTYDIYTTKYQ